MAKKTRLGPAPGRYLLGLGFGLILGALFAVNVSHAYYSFLRAGQRSSWPASSFTKTYLDGSQVDQTLWGAPLSGMASVGQIPNDDSGGLLLVADAFLRRSGSHRVNCTDGTTTRFGPPQQSEYQAIFSAMATWDQVASSTVNLAFVCSFADFSTASFDNLADADSIDVWRNGGPVFNGYNEIIFDDTTAANLVSSLNLGIDPTVLLGLAFPFDTNNTLISNTNSTGILKEGFILLNRGPQAPQADLQGTLTHELGHLLGLAHTPSINAITSNDAKTPTMYFASLSDASQTRSLEFDDIAAITMNYPSPSQPALSFGSVSGLAVGSTGSALFGTAIILKDAQQNEISIIVGGVPGQNAGGYRIDGVPPGNYRAQILALDGSANAGRVSSAGAGNIDGIFPNNPFTFQSVFYPNNTQEASAQAITVTVGQNVPDINFGVNVGAPGSGLVGQLRADPEGGCQQGRPASGTAGIFLGFLLTWFFFLRQRHHVDS